MYKRLDRRQQTSRLVITYIIMTITIVTVVAIMIMFVMGYRFDAGNQRFEQTGLIQFNTRPTGSVVEVDKVKLDSETPAKKMVDPGTHEFAMWQDGYETWWKSLDVKAGSLTWLDYARLVPKDRQVESVKSYPKVDQALFSPGGSYLALLADSQLPSLDLLDIRNSEDVKSQTFDIDTENLSNYKVETATHSYRIDEWSQGGRYILLTHKSGDQTDWLMLDRENPENMINISNLAGLAISDAQLSGSNGKTAYILTEGSLRRINLETGELSKSLASHVESFSLYSTDIVTYVGGTENDSHQRVVGLVRSDDTKPHILKTIQAGQESQINVDTARYFNQNYVAISVNDIVEIYSGEYPTAETSSAVDSDESTLQLLTSFRVQSGVEFLRFSANGRFIAAQTGRDFTSYDLERQQVSSSVALDQDTDRQLQWLDSYYVWTVEDGELVMQEYDGANRHIMNTATGKYDVSFDESNEFLYSLVDQPEGVSLQRLPMIIEE